jgi:pilus assembly protein Flp/PilA
MNPSGLPLPNVPVPRFKETPVQRLIRNFLADEAASTAMEYALLGVLVAIAVISGMSYVGSQLNQYYLNVANGI